MPYTKDTYAASCNPARRVKQAAPIVSAPIPHPTLLPKQPSIPSPPVEDGDQIPVSPSPVSAPAKRGRKPGTMSRSAREAQRKLNHSIIEKARRTKINEALATLRHLVPDNFGQPSEQATGEEDDDDDDVDDGEYGTKKKPATGKKAEKEKEFKLEILVRTVAYMQHLLEKVKEMEVDGLQKKRKRGDGQQEHEREMAARKRPNLEGDSGRLPSISSWLPSIDIDPTLLSPSERQNQTSPFNGVTQLPSPPSSTRFTPVAHSFQAPPALTLGPVAMEARTPDEESAASLLLHISSSRSSISKCSPLDGQRPPERVNKIQPLTPGSMLGL